MTPYSVKELNTKFKEATPTQVIEWVLKHAQRPILTTNFGPYSATLLHAVSSLQPTIPVLWGDSGYNLVDTYAFATALSNKLDLNLKVYVPKFTRGYIDASFKEYMADQKGRDAFAHLVKIEPLERAFKEYTPDIWFTNIRRDQTAFRKTLGVFSVSTSGILKVSPFFEYSKEDQRLFTRT
jgi:phosphoadenosine phosphosulfate reductase